jgi:hypothetical protein
MFSFSELTVSVLYTITTTSVPSLVSFYVILYWFVRGIFEILFIVFVFTPTNGCHCIHLFPPLTIILPSSATYNR